MKIKKVTAKQPKKKAPAKSKYKAKKITIDGHTFDSKMEAEYYMFLKRYKDYGEVIEIELQPVFELQPTFKYQGETVRSIKYILDFKVMYADGRIEYVDIKGMQTPVSELKLKIVKHMHPDITFKVLTKSKKYGKNGWIDYAELMKIRRANKRK